MTCQGTGTFTILFLLVLAYCSLIEGIPPWFRSPFKRPFQFLEPVGPSLDVEHVAPLHEPVEECGGYDLVSRDKLVPEYYWQRPCTSHVMGRPLRIIQTQYPYHLVCRTNNRTFRFHRKKTIRIFAKVLKQVTDKYGLNIHHFVLMSNHYHIVATATEENLHRAMQYLNSRTAFRFNRTMGRTGHLWGDRYRSCIINTDEYYLACVRYIYRNPLRANMVEDLEEFEDSSFNFWAFGKKVDLFLADDHLVPLWDDGKDRLHSYFRILVLDEGIGVPSEKVARVGLRKLFFGSADFVQRMSGVYLDY